MKKILTLSFALLTFNLFAQLPDGSISPDFSLDDLGGTTHELYDYLDEGYSAILDFSATWCGPCWNYHQAGVLEDVWSEVGPDGTDQVMVFMIEADPGTTPPCIYGPSGCSGGSIGDWTAGVDYPILNPEAGDAATVNSDFSINFYPTLYGVAPNGEIYELGQTSVSDWISWTAHSFQMHNTTWEVNDQDCTSSYIDLQPAGGEGEIQYQWSNGSTEQDLFEVEPGSYTVTMTDENDYEVVKGPIEVISNNFSDLELIDMGNVSCQGQSNGYIEVNGTGGSGDFEYEWSNGANSPMIEDLPGGDYELTLIDTGTGCEFEFEFEIEEPEDLEYEYELINPECGSSENGSIEFEVEGGTYPYTYNFDDFDTQDEYITLEPGSYEPTIIDANGCQIDVVAFEIEQTDAPVAMSQAIGNFSCVEDTVYVNVSSSSSGPNIIYSWYDQSNTLIGNAPQVQVDSAGMYTLEVLDASNNCLSTSSVMVTEDYNEPVAMASSMGDIDCNNSTTMLVSNGSTSDSSTVYTWTTMDGIIISSPNATSVEVGSAGNYVLTIDNIYSGCSQSATVTVDESDIPELTLSGDNEFCGGSTTTLCVNENGGETASWFVGGNMISNDFCVTVSDASEIEVYLTNDVTGCQSQDVVVTTVLNTPEIALNGDLNICDGQSSMLCLDNPNNHGINWMINGTAISTDNCINIDASSDIQVMMTDMSTGCQSNEVYSSVVSANPTLTLDVPNILDCNNSSSMLNLTSDATSVVWYNAQNVAIGTTESVAVTEAGQYTAIATNDLGCTTSEMVTVEANLDELPVANYQYMAVEYTFTFEDMSMGEVTNRQWDFGDGNTSSDVSPTHTYAAAGYYNVSLVTTNSCGESRTQQEVLAITDLQLTTSVSDVLCFGESNASVQLGLGGGLPGYTYEWTTPQGGTLTDANISSLDAGTYNLVVTDAAGQTIEREIVIEEPELIAVSGTIVNTTSSSSDGSISLNVSGGVAPYEVSWSNGDTGMILSGVPQGEYKATITDSNGCITEEVYTVSGTTNVSELDFIESFDVSPNPAVTFIQLNVELNQLKPLQLSLISLDGKVIQRSNKNAKVINERIDLTDIPNGIYLVELRSQNSVDIKKVIVAK